MRVVGSYVGAVVVSAVIAVGLLAVGHVDPSAPRGPLEVPGGLIAISPEFAIQSRRLGAFLASAGPEILVPLKFVGAVVVFAVMNFAALVLFESTDDAWRGVRLWEVPKPFWAALIFTSLGSALYMAALLWQVAPVPRLGLPPAGFALAALAGGVFFGLGRPRREALED